MLLGTARLLLKGSDAGCRYFYPTTSASPSALRSRIHRHDSNSLRNQITITPPSSHIIHQYEMRPSLAYSLLISSMTVHIKVPILLIVVLASATYVFAAPAGYEKRQVFAILTCRNANGGRDADLTGACSQKYDVISCSCSGSGGPPSCTGYPITAEFCEAFCTFQLYCPAVCRTAEGLGDE